MQVRLVPDPDPALAHAVASLLEREGLADATEHAYGTAWRSAALREGIAREPAWSRVAAAEASSYVAAPSPRSTRGATRA